MRTTIRLAVATVAAMLLSLLTVSPASAQAAGDVWIADLSQLNTSGSQGTATVQITGDEVTVTVDAVNLSPGLAHAQHIHLGGSNECPPPAADDNPADGWITTVEGADFYGAVAVALTTEGDVSDTSALALDRMPTADGDTAVYYARTFELPAAVDPASLDGGVIVLHGISQLFDDPGAYDGLASGESSIAPGVPLETTIPAACGALEPAELPFPDVMDDAFYTAPTIWAAAIGLTTGVGDTGMFMPMRDLTRAEMVTFLWRYSVEPGGYDPHGFPDVPANTFYEQALRWAAAEGITTGVGDTGLFLPQNPVTRAQMVTFLWRIAGEPTGYDAHGFPDVPASTYYEQALRWAAAEGITTGVGDTGEFMPEDPVTRGQLTTFLYRFNTLVGR